MTASQALRLVREYAKADRVEITRHAYERMRQRRVALRELIRSLTIAKTCKWQPAEQTWRVETADMEGEELTVIVAFEDGVMVVTVF